MQLTFNKFKTVVDSSSEKVFDKIAEAISTSDNAALVAMFDDKLILLDEEKQDLYLCDYTFENSVLAMHNFEQVALTENDESYLDEVAEKYFDLDDNDPITVGDLMTGFKLKYKDESKNVFQESIDRKYRKIMESPRIRAIKRARDARNMFSEEIKSLLEEPFVQHLNQKLFNPNVNSAESPAPALNKVTFKNPYPVFVNTEIGGPAKDLITLRDNTNIMDAMKGVALKISEKWKSEAFRKKFEKMVDQILATESVELARAAVLSFIDENKELFLLKNSLFEELVTKTTLMMGQGNTDDILAIFEKIMESKEARMMRARFFRENKIDEAKLEEINTIVEQDEKPKANVPLEKEPAKEVGNDLDSEEVNKIIDVFKKIAKSLEDDSPEAEYIDGLVSALDSAKVSGIEDSKMKEVIDFLSSVEAPKAAPKGKKEKEAPEDGEEEMKL
jgi:hypothetical protein